MKMKAALPKGDGDGLTAIEADILADPEKFRVIIAIVDCEQSTRKTDTGENIATVRVRRVEAVTDRADMDTAERLMRKAATRRNVGDQGELPFDFEEDLKAAFDHDA
jgi:hypothetical protein